MASLKAFSARPAEGGRRNPPPLTEPTSLSLPGKKRGQARGQGRLSQAGEDTAARSGHFCGINVHPTLRASQSSRCCRFRLVAR